MSSTELDSLEKNPNVIVYLRIITPSESGDGTFLILLDDDGEIPCFPLMSNSNIEFSIVQQLRKFLYENDISAILTTQTISHVQKIKDTLNIFYNFISTNTYSKGGSFVSFNQRSIELHKLSISEHS